MIGLGRLSTRLPSLIQIPFEAALEAGAQDVETVDDTHLVTTAPEDFNARERLDEIFSGLGRG